MFSYLKRILIGKPLKTLDESGQALTKFKALALLSSDALSSIAYGTEEILSVLIVLSAAATWYSIPIAAIGDFGRASRRGVAVSWLHADGGRKCDFRNRSDNLGDSGVTEVSRGHRGADCARNYGPELARVAGIGKFPYHPGLPIRSGNLDNDYCRVI